MFLRKIQKYKQQMCQRQEEVDLVLNAENIADLSYIRNFKIFLYLIVLLLRPKIVDTLVKLTI